MHNATETYTVRYATPEGHQAIAGPYLTPNEAIAAVERAMRLGYRIVSVNSQRKYL